MAITPAQFVVLFAGLALAVLALLWLVAAAFQTRFAWGLAAVVFPPSLAAFARRHWTLAREPVGLLALGGLLAGLVGLVLYDRVGPAARWAERAERFAFREQTLLVVVAIGAALLLAGFIALVVAAFRERTAWGFGVLLFPPLGLIFPIGHWRAARGPLAVMLVGALVAGLPYVLTRLPVDLGPRESLVEGERHLTLTGWDRRDYNALGTRRDSVVVQMANPDVTDDTVKLLDGFDRLRELDLNGTRLTDAGLAVIGRLPSLETLRVRGTQITDAGFREHLMPMRSLRRLEVRDTAVSAATVAEWKAAGAGRRAQQ